MAIKHLSIGSTSDQYIYFGAMCVVLLLHDGEGVSVLDVFLFMNLSWSILCIQTRGLLFSFCSLITVFSQISNFIEIVSNSILTYADILKKIH